MSHASNRRIRRRAAKMGGKPMSKKIHDSSWYTKKHTEAHNPATASGKSSGSK